MFGNASYVRVIPTQSKRRFASSFKLTTDQGIEPRYQLNADGVSEDPALRKTALDSGCIAFLIKPFLFKELIEPLKGAGGERQ